MENDENIVREFSEFSPRESYSGLDKDRLVLFAVALLEDKNIEPTFDKVVAAVFKLFPESFGLIGFPEYPDGRTIYYCVFNHCTLSKKWLVGNVQSAFRLTEKGKYFLEETKKMLSGQIRVLKSKPRHPKRKEATFIGILKKSTAFSRFATGNSRNITNQEVFDALKAPANNADLAKDHLKKYADYAEKMQDVESQKFLSFIKKFLEKKQ